ncbi:MAG: aminotransferase class V-fold PLP-dependent enzyme, partial [Acidimicrobiia bacterium]|nr:aminotransferase class V-fold PLP-dependent enzyme [Acidimicrobiia bacterium]
MSPWDRRTFLKTTAASGLVALPSAQALAAGEAPIDHGLLASSDRRRGTSDDPLGVRDQFPVADQLAYLNTASMGPVPLPVRKAMEEYSDERMMYRDPGSRRAALERARERFATLFGADTDEIALLFSTSDGENLVANAIDWRPGDNVVIDELHFTTAFVVFRELEKREGIELRIVPATDGTSR